MLWLIALALEVTDHGSWPSSASLWLQTHFQVFKLLHPPFCICKMGVRPASRWKRQLIIQGQSEVRIDHTGTSLSKMYTLSCYVCARDCSGLEIWQNKMKSLPPSLDLSRLKPNTQKLLDGFCDYQQQASEFLTTPIFTLLMAGYPPTLPSAGVKDGAL